MSFDDFKEWFDKIKRHRRHVAVCVILECVGDGRSFETGYIL